MPILDNEILWRPATLVSDAIPAQNGGRMSFAQLVSGVKNNLFPDVSQAERLAGATKWRKAFVHVNSAQDTALLNARVFIDALTPAGDFVTFTPGTATDTEDQIAGRPYGIGTLVAPVASGATQVQVACEHPADYATLTPFRVGDRVRVSDRPSTGVTGNEDWGTLTAVVYGAEVATLTLADPLGNAYAATATLVSSAHEIAAVAGAVGNLVVTSAAGTLNTATVGNLVAHNRSAIAERWTLSFTSATAYIASGLATGVLASSGSTTADFSPLNPATGAPYFTLKAAAFGGTWVSGNTVAFDTVPAAVPIWYRRRVPAGTASLANNVASLALHGESA